MPPTFNTSLVPTLAPGTLFTNLAGGDTTLNVRWLTSVDPCFYETLNRPMADITLRQLIIAKAVDTLEIQLGRQSLFPFLVHATVASGTDELELPVGWIWDIHASLPKKWEQLRLAKIKRISGTNGETDGYTGKLRLIFTANVEGSSTEVGVFYADYVIDSTLTYQPVRLSVITTDEESPAINSGEGETVGGFIVFRTLDVNEDDVQEFFDLLAIPADPTSSGTGGLFDEPAVYEIIDSNPADAESFAAAALSHGTGLLTDSAWNAIPELDSDIQSWIVTFNYPFSADANRTSTDSIVIPAGLFREFSLTAPAGDEPTGDISGTYYPVWISRIERIGTGSGALRFYFATYNITDAETDGNPSTTPVEFASLDLLSSYTDGEIVAITPINDLLLEAGTATDFQQHFGRGHVVLSSLWDGTTTDVSDFFEAFDAIVDSPADTEFSSSSTRLSSYGLDRVPKYVPTIGQSRAMRGSTSRLDSPIHPSEDNLFVTEQDQGLGNEIDLEAESGIEPNTAIDRYGYSGALCRRLVKLALNQDELGSDPNFYEDEILPRLRILLGRDPVFGDQWYNGVRFMTFNGDSWQG
jgi:hypothetical protein